jgi:hypothetical protein
MKMIFKVMEGPANNMDTETATTQLPPIPVPTPAAFWSHYYNEARMPEERLLEARMPETKYPIVPQQLDYEKSLQQQQQFKQQMYHMLASEENSLTRSSRRFSAESLNIRSAASDRMSAELWPIAVLLLLALLPT